MKHYILENGATKEVSLLEWAEWFENFELRKIAQTDISKKVWVSTVFLGIDHNFLGGGPPLLFETMVFGLDDEEIFHRSATLDEAKISHETVVAFLKNKDLLSGREVLDGSLVLDGS